MTNVLSHKEYQGLDGKTYFVEQYQEKGWKAPLWRYGCCSDDPTVCSTILSDMLRTRPNLKRLNLI